MGYQDRRPYGGRSQYDDNDYRANRNRAGYGYAGETRTREGYPSRRPPADYDYDDRGFFDRAGDEVRSWFGDEEAERRREYDAWMNRRYGDPRDQSSRTGFASSGPGGYTAGRGYAPYTGEHSGYGSGDHGRAHFGATAGYGTQYDGDYLSWRQDRMAELDREYMEYQQDKRDRFHNEYGSWRTRRSEQRNSLASVREHMDVVGSDGEHVGTVDKCRDDRIILTKSDKDAHGMHHSIPSRWIDRVEADKVVLEKTAEQAQDHWRTEHDRQAMFDGQTAGTVNRGAYMKSY